ncbi:MAG: hypothetical protein JXI33_10345 [Candidatus Aminicenantes bacterium]|nr:hypothetical protein [Candidatus Aminicenantes bacterium]
MKKTLFIMVVIVLGLTLSSCKRSDNDDPDWDGPAGLYILLEGSANPAVLFVNGLPNPSTIRVRVTNAEGTPLANQTILLRQLDYNYNVVSWGEFEGGVASITRTTNANGEISVIFFSPLSMSADADIMYIHALLQVNGHAYPYSGVPQDFISIALMLSGY